MLPSEHSRPEYGDFLVVASSERWTGYEWLPSVQKDSFFTLEAALQCAEDFARDDLNVIDSIGSFSA